MGSIAYLLMAAFYLQVAKCTERPIIGILAQETNPSCKVSYIDAAFVKAVEAAGARVVPIFIGKPFSYYRKVVSQTNGIVLPGGSVLEDTKGGFIDAAAIVYSIIKEINKAGPHYPVLGVCQGLQVLALISNNMKNNTLIKCKVPRGKLLPLEFLPRYKTTSLYGNAPQEIINILATSNVTSNFHHFCVRSNISLPEPWKILTVNKDEDGMEFISSMQYANFVGIQFHPEVSAYEWEEAKSSDMKTLLASRYFYDWLVTEARKNNNKFANRKEEIDSLIYNYNPEYTSRDGRSADEQTYYFR